MKQATEIILNTRGIEHVAPFAGLDATTSTVASNSATVFSGLPSLYNHEIPGVNANTVLADLRTRLSVINDARVLTIPPPPVQGLGSAAGFKMMLEDRAGLGSEAIVRAANDLVAAANTDPHFAGAFTLFNTGSPSVYADIDRVKAEKVGVTPTDVFSTLQVYLGSQYVNDFNFLGRTYEVVVQADGQFRRNQPDIARLKVRNISSEMVPIGTVAQLKENTIPYRVPRYDLFPAAELQGVAAPGVASGTALLRMEELAHQVLPQGIGFEWTDLSFQEQQRGTPTLLVFGAAALFVFLVLVAQYESWKLPMAIVLIVPMCLLASVTGLLARGMPIDILGANRFRRACRPGRQKCDPDCRIRTPEGRNGRSRRGGSCARRTYTAPPDLDDVLRVHLGSCPVGDRDRSRRRNAAVSGHGRAVRDVGRDLLRPSFHAGLLHLHSQSRP